MTTLSGYTTTYDFWATSFTQVNLREISIHLTIDQITSGFLPRPDPAERLEHNRAIKPGHADKFAQYLLRGSEDTTGKWSVIVPALSLFTNPLGVEFTPNSEFAAGEVQFGVLSIEKSSPVEIWDGQHRTLGAYIAVERKNKEISDLAHLLAKAKAEGDPAKGSALDGKVKVAKEERRRLGSIVIPVSIALETDKEKIAELFADVADNAKGINATALARLDHRNVFHRAASAIFAGEDGWDLLVDRIDDDNDYTSQYNVYWTTYRDVAAVAQISWLGYGARWTPNQEMAKLAAQEVDILANTREFYEVVVEAFPDIDDVLSGEIEPKELRGGGTRTSLLSSSTTIKALASAFHDLKFGRAWVDTGKRAPVRLDGLPTMSREEIIEGFRALPPSASGSKKRLDQFWLDLGVFDVPWVAPTARASNARTMSMAIVDHIRPITFTS
ncbi:MAG: DNA sulfur modification protein DndB [Pseudonocardiaceae bacterium]